MQSNGLPSALKYVEITLKLTSIVTMSVALAGEHIFQALAQYS